MHYQNKTAIKNKTASDALAMEDTGGNHAMEESKEKGKITEMHIKALDDGSYHLRSTTDDGHSQETSHPNHHHLMAHMEDNLTSPHLPKLGSGVRFANLKDQLAQKPGVRNPAGLAAYIGRKKYGNAKFDALSH